MNWRDVWFAALDHGDGEPPAKEPHVRAALDECGHPQELWDGIENNDDWIVWERGDETVVYYTPDLAGDTSTPRSRLADRFNEAGVGTKRFINCLDGQKGRFDTDPKAASDGRLSGNYGVVGGRGGDDDGYWLVDIDVDDYDSDAGEIHPGITELREETLAVASAHTTVDQPGHLYVAVDGDPSEVTDELTAATNPQASFGEIRVENQYVVGPGSEVVCPCDRCTADDAPDSMGRYEIATDATPVVWSLDEFREWLLRDPEIAVDDTDDAGESGDETSGGNTDNTATPARGWADPASVSQIVEFAQNADEYLQDAIKGARNPDDRSKADSELAYAVSPWLGNDRTAVSQVLDRHGTGKWDSRTDESYRNHVLSACDDRGVRYDGGDTPPGWAINEIAVADDLVSEDDLVVRDAETHEIVDGEAHDGETYEALPDRTYGEVLDHLAETYGFATESESSTASQPATGGGQTPSVSSGNASVTPESPAGELRYQGGCYGYVIERDEQPNEWKQATNFTLTTLAVIDADGEQQLRLRVDPATAESGYEVEVHPTVFNETRAFKDEVVRGRTTTFENVFGDALDDLRLTVGQQDCPRHTGVSHVGAARPSYDDDELPADAWNEWVTPEGVLTADGWLEAGEGEHTYFARSQSQNGEESIVGEKWALTPSHDEIDDEQVREVLRRLPRGRLPDRALATLSWFYTAPLKPLIFHAEDEFPHLSVRGKTASGKSAWLSTLSEALGLDGVPFAADATSFSLEMMHVGSRGAPVWIDEYKPSQMSPGRQDKLHTYLREATREAVHTKGRPDQSFISYRMQSPVCLSGEQTIKEPAVARRAMKVKLSARATDMQQTQQAYAELAGEAYETPDGETEIGEGYDLTDHALAYHRWLLSHDATDLLSDWNDCRDETAELLDAVGADVDDTERLAVQQTVFGWQLFNRFAAAYGVETESFVSRETLQSAVEHITDNVGKNGQRREHGDELLELMSQAAAAGYLAPDDPEHGDTPYRVYEPQAAEGDAVALHLPTVYPEVRKFVRDYGLESEYNLLSKTDYTDEFDDIAGDDSHVLGVSKAVRNVTNGKRKRCLVVDATRARRRLGEDFTASAFGARVDLDQDDPEVSDDDGGDDGGGDGDDDNPHDVRTTPLGDVASDPTGFPNVEAEIAAVSHPDHEDAPAVTATLVDDSTAMRVIAWDDPEALAGGAEARVLFENVETTTHNGDVQLVVKPGVTEQTVMHETFGEETKDARATEADSDTAETATDGGDTTAESDAPDGDPERPHGPHDDVQCRECGVHWLAGSPDDAPRRECPDCGTTVDWEWNVDTGRVSASAAPDDPDDTDHETVRGQIIEWLRGYDPDPVTVTKATVDLGVDAEDARDALDALVEDGRLIDTETEGRYEVNR